LVNNTPNVNAKSAWICHGRSALHRRGKHMQVEFHFDFGSPNAYLAHRVIPAIEARTGARFRYVPILLGGIFKATGNRSPAEAFAGIRNKPDYERLETDRFIRRHRIEGFTRNPFFPVNTLQLMRGAAAAEIDGGLSRYVNAMFHHMWESPKKLDEPDVFRDALTASGLDAAAIMARAQDPTIKVKLIANTEMSVARGAFGSPTFFVGDAIYFGKDRLRDVEDAVLGMA
jgi:2-hydroxychromene-2-carboxylate isomerase